MLPIERIFAWFSRRSRACRECGGELTPDDDRRGRLHRGCTSAYLDSAAV